MKILILTSRPTELQSLFTDLDVLWLESAKPDVVLDILKSSSFACLIVDDLHETLLQHDCLKAVKKEVNHFPCYAIKNHEVFPPINPFHSFPLEDFKKSRTVELMKGMMEAFVAYNEALLRRITELQAKSVEEISIKEESEMIESWSELSTRMPGFKDKDRPQAKKIAQTLDKLLNLSNDLLKNLKEK